jgi:DNA-binding MarR family transcriptional regulator
MKNYPFQHLALELRALLPAIMKLSARSIEQRLAEYDVDISGLQFGLLKMLQRHPFTLSQLSKLFMLDPSTLVPVVDTLERKGFIERGRDPNDRRRVPLHLTEKAIALLEAMPTFHEDDVLVKSLAQLGQGKSVQLVKLLRELVQSMPEGETVLCNMYEHLDIHTSSQNKTPNDIV